MTRKLTQVEKYRQISLALNITLGEAKEAWLEAFREECEAEYDDFCTEFQLEATDSERYEYAKLRELEELAKDVSTYDKDIQVKNVAGFVENQKEYRPKVGTLEKVKATPAKYIPDELLEEMEEAPEVITVDQEAATALEQDLQRNYETRKNTVLESKYKALLKNYGQLEDRYAESLSIRTKRTATPPKTRREKQTTNQGTLGEATPILLLSDWHVGEHIEAGSVNGENSFNPEVAQERAEWLFTNAAKLIRKEARDVNIKQAVVWLGGDFISNYIHPELMETNTMSPTEEIYFAQELITNGINYLLENTGIEKLIVPTSVGNHGRTTIKTHIATATQNSLEQLMYRNIKRHYNNTPEVEFLLSDGYLNYLDVYGKTLRFAHGDAVRGGMGVGGITIPLLRWIGKTNANRRADMDFLGHFHSVHFNPQFTINGSLCGANAYSTRLGCKNEVAKQALLLLDRDLGFTYNLPVFCFDTSR